MSTPETIYLIPGEDGLVWCDDPAPDEHCDPSQAVKYVRADRLPTPCLPPFPPEGDGLPRYGIQWNGPADPITIRICDGYWTPWHLAIKQLEQAQARAAELESSLAYRRVIIEKAFILRQQAEAVEAAWRGHCRESVEADCKVLYRDDMEDAVNDLRQQADEVEETGGDL